MIEVCGAIGLAVVALVVAFSLYAGQRRGEVGRGYTLDAEIPDGVMMNRIFGK